jgi:hypothetical protein
MTIQQLQAILKKGRIVVTKHGTLRTEERNISIGEIIKAVYNGKIVEIREENGEISYLIAYKKLRVAVATDGKRLYLKTTWRGRRKENENN